jgi:hypothetical protein
VFLVGLGVFQVLDMHGLEYEEPILDETQDWLLVQSTVLNGETLHIIERDVRFFFHRMSDRASHDGIAPRKATLV